MRNLGWTCICPKAPPLAPVVDGRQEGGGKGREVIEKRVAASEGRLVATAAGVAVGVGWKARILSARALAGRMML